MTPASSKFGLLPFVCAARPKGMGCAVDTRAAECLQHLAMGPQRQTGEGQLPHGLLHVYSICRVGRVSFVYEAARSGDRRLAKRQLVLQLSLGILIFSTFRSGLPFV